MNIQIAFLSRFPPTVTELKGHTATKRFDLAAWRRAVIIIAILGGLLAAAIYHRPLIQDIASYFNQSQNPDLETPSTGEPAPIDDIKSNFEDPGESDGGNSPATGTNASGISESEPSGVSAGSSYLDSVPDHDSARQASLVNEQAPIGKKPACLK